MRAFRVSGTDDASVPEVDKPIPANGEVIVRVGAAGLCHSDVQPMSIAGFLGGSLPFTAGHEIADWVDQVGDGVSSVTKGQSAAVYGPVGCGRRSVCAHGRDQLCATGLRPSG